MSSPSRSSLRPWLAALLAIAFAVTSAYPLYAVEIPEHADTFGPWTRKLGTAAVIYVLEGLLCCAVLGPGAVGEALGRKPGRVALLAVVPVALLWFGFTLWSFGPAIPGGYAAHPIGARAMEIVVLVFAQGWLTFGVLWASLSRIVSPHYLPAVFPLAMIATSLGTTAIESMHDDAGPTDWFGGVPAVMLFALLFGIHRHRSGGFAAPTFALVLSQVCRWLF